MSLLIIPLVDKTAIAYQASVVFDSGIKKATVNSRYHKRGAALKIATDTHTQFAKVLIHEVRNPLTNINLAIEVLEKKTEDPALKNYLDIIKRSSTRINKLVCDLLNNQQAEEATTVKHSIYQLLDEVLEMAEDRLRLKKVTVRKDYTARDCKIAFNKNQMLFGVTNIVVNAIDAMTTGKGKLKVITKIVNGRYNIIIEDNGCGISKENLEKIFKPYFTNKPGGLGLGLATSFDLLLSNHVLIDVKSILGKGTRFILSFVLKHRYDLFH